MNMTIKQAEALQRLLDALIIGLAVIAALFVLTMPPAASTEDDPGWDCRTMGNRTCGQEVER